MRTRFADIQQKATKPLTCFERGHLESEVGRIEFQQGHADYVKSRVTDRIAEVRNNITDVEGSRARLLAAAKASTTGTPAPISTADDIQAAITAANDKVTTVSASLQQSMSKVDDYYNQGKAVLTKARDFMSTVKCSG